MFSLRKPSVEAIRRFLASQAELSVTYSPVGATARKPPEGYEVEHTRIKLGQGEAVFTKAKQALKTWQQFNLGWVEIWSPETPIKTGETVAILARAVGLWWLNASRIVYVVSEDGPISRFGFAYGTLPDHAQSGEERFSIEWDRVDDTVWYDISAFSKPHQFLPQLGYLLVCWTQKRFALESAAAMLRVASEIPAESTAPIA